MLARLGRVLLVVAVLLAQQTALAHQYWHSVGAQAKVETPKQPKGDGLCDLHDLLGTVLGVASGTAQLPAFLDFSQPGFAAFAARLHEALLLAPHSRDPPLDS